MSIRGEEHRVQLVIIVLITAVVAFALAAILLKLLDHLRLTDAETRARTIVTQAEQDIDNRPQEAEAWK